MVPAPGLYFFLFTLFVLFYFLISFMLSFCSACPILHRKNTVVSLAFSRAQNCTFVQN
jgi:hypothetical protein